MATSTQNVGPANIPVVNFSLLSSGAPQERNESLKQLDDAFQTYGFIYLSNHSIPQEMSKRFFDLPHHVKQLIAHPESTTDHRGFAKVGLGLVRQGIWDPAKVENIRKTVKPEQKKVLEMGNPYSSDDPDANPYPNRLLPEDMFPGFRGFIEKWWD